MPHSEIPKDIDDVISKLSSYISDKSIMEIKLSEPNEIAIIHLDGRLSRKKIELNNFDLMCFGKSLAAYTNQRFSVRYPSLSAKLPGKEARVQMMMPPMVDEHVSFCIRLSKGKKVALKEYFKEKEDIKAFLDILYSKDNFLISGGTGAGKTTFANAVIEYIPVNEWLVTVEDTRELHVPHENHFNLLVSRSSSDAFGRSYTDALDDARRLNPGRIILGEISTKNASSFLSFLNIGKPGFATIHANSADTALVALAKNIEDGGKPYKEALKQATQFISAVVHLEQSHGHFSATLKVFR